MWFFSKKHNDEGGERSLFSRIIKREGAVEIVQDSLKGFIAYPKATYLGIREAQIKLSKMSSFDRVVEKWEFGVFGVIFSLGIIFLFTTDGLPALVRLIPLTIVGFMWFARVGGWNPIRAFLRRNLTPITDDVDGVSARPGASPAVVREVMALHLESALVLLRQWDKYPRKERLDQAPMLAFDFMNILVKCTSLLEANDIDGAIQLIKTAKENGNAESPIVEVTDAPVPPSDTSDSGRT